MSINTKTMLFKAGDNIAEKLDKPYVHYTAI